jgi:hypothetical protein
MIFQSKVICPRCQTSRCRESRWLSLEEKRNHQENTPFRCLDCSFRFLGKKSSGFGKGLVIPVPVALLAVTLAVVICVWLASVESTSGVGTSTPLVATDLAIRQAADAGDAGAQFKLGEALLLDPSHGPENSANALRWLQLSAENGNTEAMIVLGRLFRSGVGILQNFGQASKWIQTAAASGNPEGMLELGRLYRDGVGMDKDLVMAYVWFNRASAARNLDAVREREEVARTLTTEELKEAQVRSSAQDSDDDYSSGLSAQEGLSSRP